jgi:hypothetical protein
MSRSRYTYRRPCRTKYNPDYYSRDYNTEYNAISISKLHYRKYSQMRSRLRLGDPKLHNYNDHWRLPINFGINPESSPSSRCSLRSFMRLVAGRATTFKEGDDRTGIATPIANNYRPGSAGTKHHKLHSPIEKGSSGKCTWTWINSALGERR